jgi:hypothetical protein
MSTKKLPEQSVKVMLAFPEKVSGVEVDHVVMRRPKVRDRIAASKACKDPQEAATHIAASLCEIPLEEMAEFDEANWKIIEAQYEAFSQARS